MIIVLVSFALVTVLVSWYWIRMKESFKKGLKEGAGYIITWNCLLAALLIGIVSVSYANYLMARSFYSATVEQYTTAIEMYGGKAVIDIEAAAWTDLKYQGYQQNIAAFIATLRDKITSYNEVIIQKRVLDANPLLSWLIIAPDGDMKIIKMKAASKHIK